MFDSLSDWLNQKVHIGNSTNTTLDHQHEQILTELDKEEKRLPVLEKKVDVLEKRLRLIQSKSIEECSTEELHSRHFIQLNIEKYENFIKLIKENNMKSKYLLEVSDILYDYYTDNGNNLYTKKISSTTITNDGNDGSVNSNNITNGSSQKYQKGSDEEEEETMYIELFEQNQQVQSEPVVGVNGIEAFITSTVRSDKSDVLNQYMSVVNNKFHGDLYIHGKNKCPNCHHEFDLNIIDGTATCPECARTEIRLIESSKPNFKEPVQNNSYFCYKRINHFNENLNQIQAKESTDIPQMIMDLIKKEIRKSRITDLSKLSVPKMKGILKKLKLNKYYEHVPHIINKLNGLPPPKLSAEVEDKLRRMFKEIQAPFEKVCPNNRKNFLNYSYVLHKMVQLLSLDEFLICFPLLKSRDKLHAQDQVWKGICKELRWEFIPSC